MRLRGHEKRAQTADRKHDRKHRTRLRDAEDKYVLYSTLEPKHWNGAPAERWEWFAAASGWLESPLARVSHMGMMMVLWPQQSIYEMVYAQTPFLGILKMDGL